MPFRMTQLSASQRQALAQSGRRARGRKTPAAEPLATHACETALVAHRVQERFGQSGHPPADRADSGWAERSGHAPADRPESGWAEWSSPAPADWADSGWAERSGHSGTDQAPLCPDYTENAATPSELPSGGSPRPDSAPALHAESAGAAPQSPATRASQSRPTTVWKSRWVSWVRATVHDEQVWAGGLAA
jgi:hypothetical protein